MTFQEVLRALVRRWYVVVAVVAVVTVGGLFLQRDGGLYTTRTVVSFTLPGQSALQPDSGTSDENVISFAALVAQEINGGHPAVAYATDAAPYYGAGLREGVSVGLPNTGGQWSTSFSSAEIEIQIVGRTEQWVHDKQSAILEQVLATADAQQDSVGAADGARISTTVQPLTTRIEYVASSRGATMAAFAALAIAGGLVAAWGSVVADRIARKRRSGTRFRLNYESRTS